MTPQRIQLKRAKGWRLPPNTVKVDRSTKWGNPFVAGTTHYHFGWSNKVVRITNAMESVQAYAEWLVFHPDFRGEIKEHLRGHNLACWCKPGEPCHADVLLKIANA